MENLTNPFVSVIVPVFNDVERLKICLEALENQTYPQNLYEIIVVDNASDKVQNIEEIVNRYDRAIYTYESTPGSYAARNQGISLAKGEVLAFTDADCIPAPNWLEKGIDDLLKVPNCGLVAGKVEVFCKNPDRPTPIELYEQITAFPQEKLLKQHKGGATANIFTFKEVFNCVGLFDTNLKSHGDLEWGQRVCAKGYAQVYAENVCVAHPARASFAQLYKRTTRLIAGNYALQCQVAADNWQKQPIFWVNLAKNLIPPVNFILAAFQDSRLPGLKHKIQVSLVMFFVRYVSAWELCKLQLGSVAGRE